MTSLILVIISVVIFLRLNRHYQFVVFSLAALYPFTFGDLSSIPDVLVVEWLTILTFLSLINQIIPLNSLNKKLKSIRFKGLEIFIFALFLLITWVLISYINNEIFSNVTVSGSKASTKRAYFEIFNNVLIFFTTIIFLASYYQEMNIEKLLKTILYCTLIIGFVRIFAFYLNIDAPLLGGIFNYNPESAMSAGLSAQRLLGLDYTAAIGIPAIFSLYIYKNKLNFFILFILLAFLFLSGGRTTMIGVFISIVIFSIVFLPKNFVYFIIASGFIFLIAIFFLPHSFFENKINRLSTMQETGFMGQDIWRGTAWYFFLKNFVANPIFGKGIGNFTSFIYSTVPGTEYFVRQQMIMGGHGSYFSLLGTLGLGGITYFLIMVFGGIILSFKKIKHYLEIDQDKTAIAVFSFMVLINISVILITGMNGLTDIPFVFYLVGLICSIRVIENFPAVIESDGTHM